MQAEIYDDDNGRASSHETDGRQRAQTTDVCGAGHSPCGGVRRFNEGCNGDRCRLAKALSNEKIRHKKAVQEGREIADSIFVIKQTDPVIETWGEYTTVYDDSVYDPDSVLAKRAKTQQSVVADPNRVIDKHQAPFEHRPFDPEAVRAMALQDPDWWG